MDFRKSDEAIPHLLCCSSFSQRYEASVRGYAGIMSGGVSAPDVIILAKSIAFVTASAGTAELGGAKPTPICARSNVIGLETKLL